MKILFVTTRWPLPPITGDRLRAYYMLKELSQKHDVTLVSFYTNPEEVKMIAGSRFKLRLRPVHYQTAFSYLKALRGLFSARPLQLHYYNFYAMRRIIQQELATGGYDLIFTQLIRAAQYVENERGIPKIADLIDAISLTYRRILNYPDVKRGRFSSQLYAVEQKRVFHYETKLLSKFDRILLVSTVDRNYLEQCGAIELIDVIPNGVNANYFRYSPTGYDPYRITFHGNIHYYPNNDAVLYFYHQIFPRIKMKEPRAKFYIVGNGPRPSVMQLKNDPDVYITGKINDIRPYLLDTAVSICPIRMGAGVQNKILEAMACGPPVVASPLGLEGLDAVPGKHLLVADTPQDFADNVVELLHHQDLHTQLSRQARDLIEGHYTWEQILVPLNRLIESF